MRRDEALELPADLDYSAIGGLSTEVRQKLSAVRPASLGQAGRIDGITPAALTRLLSHVKRRPAPQRRADDSRRATRSRPLWRSSGRRRGAICSASSRCSANGSATHNLVGALDARRHLDAACRRQPAASRPRAGRLSRMGRSRQRGRVSRARRRHRLQGACRRGISRWSNRTGRRRRSCAPRSARRAPTRASPPSASRRMRRHAGTGGCRVGARAGAAGRSCCGLARPILHEDGVMLLLKGQDFVQEIDAASKSLALRCGSLAERDRFERMRARHPQRPARRCGHELQRSAAGPPACPRHRQPEGRGGEDDDRHQSRHGAGGDRRDGADRRPRPAGQRLDRARRGARSRTRCRPTMC